MHRSLYDSLYKLDRDKLYDTSTWGIFRKYVKPVEGSVVWCDLGAVEHSGIYVGNGKIVHLDGSGMVETVSYSEFMDRLGGWNNAINIFVSCKNGKPVGSKKVAKIAKKWVGKERSYSLLVDNFHRFSAGCVLDDFDEGEKFLYFNQLATICGDEMGVDEWGVWDTNS